MNSDQLEGKWKQVKGEVREKWGKLTDDDIHVVAGRREQLIGKIQERYGIAKARAAEEVDEFMRALHEQPSHNIRDPDEMAGEESGGRAKSHTAAGR